MAQDNSIDISTLPPDQQQHLLSQIPDVTPPDPNVPNAPQPGLDLVDAINDSKELGKLAIDQKFNPKAWLNAHPDAPEDRQQLVADAYAHSKTGFRFKDLEIVESLKAVAHLPVDLAKATQAGAQEVLNPLYDLVSPKLAPGADAELKKQRAADSAAFVSSKEASLVGVADVARRLGKWGARQVGKVIPDTFSDWAFKPWLATALKEPKDQTPQERLASLWNDAGIDKYKEGVNKGHGPLTQAVLGRVISDLEASGGEVNPEIVNQLAAGDIFAFEAFGGGFRIGAAAIKGGARAVGKTVATAANKTAAVQAVAALNAAQRAAAKAGSAETAAANTAAGALESELGQAVKAGEAITSPGAAGERLFAEGSVDLSAKLDAAAGAAQAAREAERALGTVGANVAASPAARLVQQAGKVGGQLVEVKEKVGAALGATAERGIDLGMAAIPAGVGVATGIPFVVGKTVAGILPPIATPHWVRTIADMAGTLSKKSFGAAKTLAEGEVKNYSPLLGAVSSVGQMAPSIIKGAVQGAGLDVALAAATSETPAETAEAPFFMTAIGAAGGVGGGVLKGIRRQLIGAKNIGSDSGAASRPYNRFSALDAANKFTVEQAENPDQVRRLSAIRDFVKGSKTQMYWVSDKAMLRDILKRYDPGFSEEVYDQRADQNGAFLTLRDDAGQLQKVGVFKTLDAAPEEAGHAWQAVMGDRAMSVIDNLVYDEYAPHWEDYGKNYVARFYSPKELTGYYARGESWREAMIDLSLGNSRWREKQVPQVEIDAVADQSLNREISASIGEAIFNHGGPELLENKSLPGKIARILAKTYAGFGIDPFQGMETEGQNIPLKYDTVQKVRQELQAGIKGAKTELSRPDVTNIPGYGKAKVSVTPRGRPEPPAEGGTPAAPTEPPPAPNEPGGAAEKARELIPDVSDQPTIRGGRSQQEILADVATAIESRGGLSVDYMSAPGEPAGAITSNRTARRDIIEIFRTMPAAMRKLWEKNFFPEQAVRAGNKVQIIGWSPEVFAANAHKLAKALSEKPGSPPMPYEIDKKTGTFTERGWRELYVDATNFAKNQAAGLTGAGESLVVPAGTIEKGFFPPRVEGEAGAPLDQAKADIISALFGIPIPKTPRIGKVYPRNLIGQEVSEATKPGRVSVPVEAREPFSGAKAEALGIEGQTIKEVNPFRAELEAAGVEWSPIEALQRLNLENIAAVTPMPVETAPLRGREFTLQAGFQPKKDNPRAIKESAIRSPKGEIFTGPYHGDASIKMQRKYKNLSEKEFQDLWAESEEGFITNAGEFLDRDTAFARAKELEQISEEDLSTIAKSADSLGDAPYLEAGDLEQMRRFQPADIKRFAELPADDFVKEMRSVKGGLTGRAYELGRSLTPEDIPALQAASQAAREKFQATMKAGDFGAAAPEANRKQFFDEALRFRNALTAAEGITDPARLSEIALEFGVDNAALTGRPGADFKAAFQPGTRGSIGLISEEGEVVSKSGDLSKLTHESFGRKSESDFSWRYNPETKTIYWHDQPFSEITKETLVAWLQRRGNEVKNQTDMTASDNAYARAHGVDPDAKFSPRPLGALTESGKELEKKGFKFIEDLDIRPNQDFNYIAVDLKFPKTDPADKRAHGWITANLDLTGGRAEIRTVHVPEGERGKGIGEVLYRELATRLQEAGITELNGEAISPGPISIRKKLFGELESTPSRMGGSDVRSYVDPDATFQPKKLTRAESDALEKGEVKDQKFFARNNKKKEEARGKATGELIDKFGEAVWDKKPIMEREELIADRMEELGAFGWEGMAQFAPKKDKKDWKFKSTSSGTTASKAWILPDGTPVQLGSQWHEAWLRDQPELQEKYGIEITDQPDESNRTPALQAGFARVNYEPASGRMTVEARAKDWRGLKGPVQDMAEANLDNIEKFSINVLNAAANKAVDSARDEFLFRLNTPAEKSARISEMINSIEGATAGVTAGAKEPSAIEIARARFQPSLKEGDRAIFSRKNSGMWDSSNSALEEGTPVIVDEARLKDGKPFWYGVETEGGTSFRVGVNQLSKFQSGRGETDSLPGFDVAREPLHPSERASMTRQELRNHFPEAVVPRANNETLTSDIVDSPLYQDAKDEPAAVKAFADRLVAFAKEYKNDPAFDLGARWYSEFVPKLKKEYGKDAGLMAELLSATSPNTSVETNFGYAFDALESLRAGRFDKIISKFEEGLAKIEDGSWEAWLKRNAGEGTMTPAAFLAAWINKFNLKPTQSNGKLYGQHSLNVLKVLAREWLGKAGGPKTKQFVENLIGRSNEATIDVWADRTMRWAGYEGTQDRWRILAENQGGVSDKDFAFSQKAFHAAAERLKLEPSALQGALWFAEKQRWADNGWGRLNLGSFQTEMEKLPELRKGFQHRMKQAEAAKKAKPREQIPLAIESRFP